MGQGVSRPSHDAGSHRPPRPSLDHLREECRELSTPRRTRPQAWSRAAADARDNQGKRLIVAPRQSKNGTQKNACEPQHTSRSLLRYRPPLHTLVVATVLIQIVARYIDLEWMRRAYELTRKD